MKNYFIKIFITFISILNHILGFSQNFDINKVESAVVLVQIYDFQGNKIGHGSGFIIDSKGTVVTNYHVVENAYSVKIISETKQAYDMLKILKGDKKKDLAILSIRNPSNVSFPYLKISGKIPNKGIDCWAIGTPVNEKYMNTVSKGLISNIYKSGENTLLQTNAEISHGSSGGPLINNSGEVVGITTGGDPSEDGSRANINFAVWSGHILELETINKDRLISPDQIPGRLSFYIDSPSSGDIYIYINNTYIGLFSSYFPNVVPNCGQDGTITRYLYGGTHQYRVFNSSTNQTSYGVVTLSPGECKLVRIANNYKPPPTHNTPTENVYIPPVDTYVFRNNYAWLIGAGISFYDGGALAFQASVEKYLNDRLSIRGNVRMELFTGVGIDMKKYFSSKNAINWYVAPSVLYMFDYFTWAGLKVGADINFSDRIVLNADAGIGRSFDYGLWDFEANFIIGYRFKKKAVFK
jgi:hypothetical protein